MSCSIEKDRAQELDENINNSIEAQINRLYQFKIKDLL